MKSRLRSATTARLPLSLGLLCTAVAFLQRPGRTVTDTRIDLSADPGLFMHRAMQVFSGTGDLGHVQAGQFGGYLFPMGPWYAATEALGVPTWIAQRLWLAALLFVAAYGMVRLMGCLLGPHRGVAHAVAGVLFALNPFTVVYVSRSSVSLLALAILPWLMLAVARGVRVPRGWRWPAATGLLVACSGAGVNAATLAWIGLAPLALLVWEATAGGAGGRAARQFAGRALACVTVVSLWWIVPVAGQSLYGADFLRFTEQPQTIWATTSMSESLRLLGYWPMYLGAGYGEVAPVMRIGRTYLFNDVALLGSFAVPAVALLSLRSTRRWVYAPFFALLACATLVVMCAGFPNGTPFGHTLNAAYTHVPALRFLRTTYKAGPVLALALAALGGVAAQVLTERVRARALGRPTAVARVIAGRLGNARAGRVVHGAGRYLTPSAIGLALLALAPVAWALPLFTGHAIDRSLAYGKVPAAWRAAIADADRAAGTGHRTLVLPGQLYGNYRWGRTWDSLAPALAEHALTIRQAVRYSDPRAAQLLDTVDDLVQQQRLVPGQLPPLLRLLGVGPVLVPTDAKTGQSGGLDPARAAEALKGQPGFTHPVASYGPARSFVPPAGVDGPVDRLPELSRYDTSASPGLVRTESLDGVTVLDGGPDGIAELAAHDGLADKRAVLYAADVSDRRLAELVRAGARLVFTDTNRRRLVAATHVRQDRGTTLTAAAPIPGDAAVWEPFGPARTADQTVAEYSGLAELRTPQPTGAQLYPAFRAYAAIDGDPRTSWLPDPSLPPEDRAMELRPARPATIGTMTVSPKPVDGISPLWLGVSVNGGPERETLLQPGPNQVAVNATAVRRLRLRLSRTTGSQLFLGAGGLSEVAIPGLTPVREALRLPTRLATAADRLDTRHSDIEVLLSRDQADFPTRAGRDEGIPLARSEIAATDPERGLERTVTLPAARRFDVSGWASVSPAARDQDLDALAGTLPAGWQANSSSRFEGLPASRASAALDGDAGTPWVADLVPKLRYDFGQDTSALPLAASGELFGGAPEERWRGALADRPSWSVTAPLARTVKAFRLVPGPARYATPAEVQVVTDGGSTQPLPVARTGTVKLPFPVRTRTLGFRIIRVRPPQGPAGGRLLRAVALGEVRSPFGSPHRPSGGALPSRCGALTIRGTTSRLPLAVSATVAAFDAGAPLRFAPCGSGRTLALEAGRSTLLAPPGSVFRPDHVRLDSPAPAPLAARAAGTARVDGGVTAAGIPRGATVDAPGPAWLVLGVGYSAAWRASCGDHALGAPTPIDGYANGWRVPAGCRHVTFAFSGQRSATASYVVSLLAVPILLALVLLRRFREPAAAVADPLRRVQAGRVKLDWFGALAVGTAATLVIGYFFAIPLGPLAIPIMMRGTSARRLFGLGGGLLVAVPIAYLIRAAPNSGGYDFGFAYDNLLGHWLAVAGVCAIAGGCILEMRSARSSADPPLSPPGDPARSPGPEPLPLTTAGSRP